MSTRTDQTEAWLLDDETWSMILVRLPGDEWFIDLTNLATTDDQSDGPPHHRNEGETEWSGVALAAFIRNARGNVHEDRPGGRLWLAAADIVDAAEPRR